MNTPVRIALVATLAIVAVVALVFIVKLVFAAATLAFVALASFYLFNFCRAYVRRLEARRRVLSGPPSIPRP